MSFASAHPSVPEGEDPRSQKIEFCLANHKFYKMNILE